MRRMFRLQTEDELRDAFRPKDRDVVELLPEMKFPLFVRDYLAWVHPSGGRVFLLFAVPNGAATGIVFQSNGGNGTSVAQMCDWCHSYGVGTQIGLLTAQLNANKRVGVHLCSDLSCRQKIEDEANRAGKNPLPLLKDLVERIGVFASDGLKIDLFR